MNDVNVKFSRFKMSKLLGLAACAAMAVSVITIPVSAAEDEPLKNTAAYTSDANPNINGLSEKEYDLFYKMSHSSTITNSEGYELYFGEFLNAYPLNKMWYNDGIQTPDSEVAKLDQKYDDIYNFVKNMKSLEMYDPDYKEENEQFEKMVTEFFKLAGIDYGVEIQDFEITITFKYSKPYMEFGEMVTEWVNTRTINEFRKVATSDAQDPAKVVAMIEKTSKEVIELPFEDEKAYFDASIFEAAKRENKKLEFKQVTKSGKNVKYSFDKGFETPVSVNMGFDLLTDNEVVNDLQDENALAIEFYHEGALPGPMTVYFYDEAYKDIETETQLPLYWLNPTTGKLEKQEQTATVLRGAITFTINHCSTYVISEKEITEEKLQVAEPVVTPDNETTKQEIKNATGGTDPEDDAMKDTATSANGMKSIALLGICGLAVYIATRKEEKA